MKSKVLAIGVYLEDLHHLQAPLEKYQKAVIQGQGYCAPSNSEDVLLYKAIRVPIEQAEELQIKAKEEGLSVTKYTAGCIRWLVNDDLL